MTEDLKNLLQVADAGLAPPESRPPAVAELRARWAHRRRRRIALFATAAALLIAATVAVWPGANSVQIASPASGEAASDSVDMKKVQIELAQLEQDAQTALAVARGIAAARQADAGATRAPTDLISAPELALLHSDRAAMIGVAHADRLCEALRDARAVLELYQHTADLFPQSRWSVVARQRIQATLEMN